jgi:glycosyltransferase involved in cell wall biosynthesis
MPINIKRADKIITVSKFSKCEIVKYYPKAKNKIKVIHLGIDEKFKKLKNIKKKNQILYVGSINERKNFSRIIKAYELLNNKNLKLLVVGNFLNNFNINDESKKLLEKAYKNKNIEFKQNINNDELVKIYNESKLLLFPSFYEGFGLPPLEAMACGTPVIISNISSLPEVGGDAAVYCNPYDVEDIKEKIEIILNNEELQKQMIEKGVKRVNFFTWEKAAKEHIKIFKEVLSN